MRIEEERYLKNQICDKFSSLFPNGVTVNDFIEMVKAKDLYLEMQGIDGVKIIDDDCINEISKTIPYLIRIAQKPHSFIRAKDEKVQIEAAKKINYKAIQHLSRDSNDWYARTFLSVKPKNIVAETNEETLNIYENRFIVTLIDRLHMYVLRNKREQEKKKDRLEKEETKASLERDYSNRGFRKGDTGLINSILNGDGGGSFLLHEISERIVALSSIENKVKLLKSTDFYQILKKARKVSKPIQKTSVIVHDQNYNRAFRLWELLDNKNLDDTIALDDEEREHVDNYYFSYAVFSIIVALVDLGFSEKSNNQIRMVNEILRINASELRFQKGKELFSIALQEPIIEVSYCVDEKKGLWEKFFIKANHFNFEGLSRIVVGEKTDEIIREQIKQKKAVDKERAKKKSITKVVGYYDFVSIDIHHCSANNEFRDAVYRRLYSIGDNFDSDEPDIEDMASYQTGIQIISPTDMRSNILRIQRIINARILSEMVFSALGSCPICGAVKEYKRQGGGECRCYNCGHAFSDNAKCVNCKKTFRWVKYLDEQKITETAVVDKIRGQPYYFRLGKYEMIMGKHAITSFDLNEENPGTWKLKSICPHCCAMLGEIKV